MKSLLPILEWPDPRLRTRAVPVARVDDGLRQLIDAMLETMYATRGIGLAATQVDVHQRLLVLDVSEEKDTPMALVNPEILSRDLPGMSEESCLSVPGVTEAVARALRVRVHALDRHGQPFELDAEGLLAVCIQHEIDHLDGTLFVDHLPWLKRLRVRGRVARAVRQRPQGSTSPGALPSEGGV
jgi:peptide deformylase